MDILTTVIWVSYEAWTMAGGGRSPHRPPHDHKLHPRHTPYSDVTLDIGTRSLNHTSGVEVQGWWCRYGYGNPLFNKCYMRHGPRLTWVDHTTDHIIMSNYNPDMVSYYPSFWNDELQLWTSLMVWWYKDNDAGMYMLSRCFRSVIWVMQYVWQGWITP